MDTNDLQRFLTYLKNERNFSDHTVTAYKNDVLQFIAFLEQEQLDFRTFEYRDARNYLVSQYNKGLERTTVSRRICITLFLWVFI